MTERLKIDENEIIRLYTQEKLSLREIAELFNCSHEFIRKRLKGKNIEINPPHVWLNKRQDHDLA